MESSTNISITWELVRTTESQAPPQTYWTEICILTKSHGDSWAPSSLRSTALEMVRCPIKENIFFLSEVTERGHMKRSWPTNNEKWKDQFKKKIFFSTNPDIFTKHWPAYLWASINSVSSLSSLGGNITLMKSNTSSAAEDSQIYYHQSKYYYMITFIHLFIHLFIYAMQLPRYFSTLFTLIHTWLWNLSS